MKKIILILMTCLLVSCGGEEGDKKEQKTRGVSQNDSNTVVDQTSTGSSQPTTPEIQINPNTPFKVLSISEGIYDNTNALQINFNLPVKKGQGLDQLIRVMKVKELIKTDWIFSENQMALYFPFIEAETQYEVNISQSLMSSNNKTLAQTSTVRVETQPKQKTARFISKGNTLLSSDNELPIEAVNVDAVELKFWKVKQANLHTFLQDPNKRDIYSLKRLTEVADLVYTSHYQLGWVKNKTENHNLPIDDIDVIKSSGVYFVTMMPDDASYQYDFESTWFIQTDLGLHARTYKNNVAVFVHKLPAAEVYPNVTVSLMNSDNEVVPWFCVFGIQ